jgi:hypothetical protein
MGRKFRKNLKKLACHLQSYTSWNTGDWGYASWWNSCHHAEFSSKIFNFSITGHWQEHVQETFNNLATAIKNELATQMKNKNADKLKSNSTQFIRTCTVLISSILRSDLPEHIRPHVHQTLEETIKETTNFHSDLAAATTCICLSLKTS